MKIEEEQQYQSLMGSYQRLKQDIKDAIRDGLSRADNPNLGGMYSNMLQMEDDLIDYETNSGKTVTVVRSPDILNKEDHKYALAALSRMRKELDRAGEGNLELLKMNIVRVESHVREYESHKPAIQE